MTIGLGPSAALRLLGNAFFGDEVVAAPFIVEKIQPVYLPIWLIDSLFGIRLDTPEGSPYQSETEGTGDATPVLQTTNA